MAVAVDSPSGIIAAGLGFELPDSQKWWDSTAPVLESMLQDADYDTQHQYKILLFFYRFIVPHLGPFPELKNEASTSFWKSFMTEDHSPMEMSWAWESINGNPKVRFSIEAIGREAGSTSDPFNQKETMKLIARLKATQPQLKLELFEYFHAAFQVGTVNKASIEGYPNRSSLGLGFDFSGGRINTGAYLTPPASISEPAAGWNFAYETISAYNKDGVSFPSAGKLHHFLTDTDTGRELCFVGLGIDCVDAKKSRLKIYLRSQRTSRENIKMVLTMCGETTDSWTDVMLEKLYTLIDMVAPGYKVDEDVNSPTSGILYNFDIHGSMEPYSRIYIPVKHYGEDDLTIAENLERFQAQERGTIETGEYIGMLRKVCSHRKLNDDKGLQTFIAISPKGGKLAMAAYLSPQVYDKLSR